MSRRAPASAIPGGPPGPPSATTTTTDRLDLFVANYIDLSLDALPEFGSGKNCLFRGLAVQCGPRGLKGAGDSLYHNNGDGTFTDVSTAAGVADPALRFGMGVAWCDFNEDGHIDLYVANDSGPNYLYKNNGNGTFTDVGLASGTALSENGAEQASMGVAIGDYDHRGRWNIIVTNFSDEYNAVYRHEKDFLFTDASYATRTAKPSLPFVGWGVKFFDYDNDGWQDLMVVNGHVYPQLEKTGLDVTYRQRKLVYRNDRDGTFTEVAKDLGPALDLARRQPRRRVRRSRQRWRHRCRRQQPRRAADGAAQRRRQQEQLPGD